MPEGYAEVPGEGVLHVDQVLLPQGFIKAEGGFDLLPRLRRDVGVERVEGRVVAGLRLHQEERQCDYQEKGQGHLPSPPDQVVRHCDTLLLEHRLDAVKIAGESQAPAT